MTHITNNEVSNAQSIVETALLALETISTMLNKAGYDVDGPVSIVHTVEDMIKAVEELQGFAEAAMDQSERATAIAKEAVTTINPTDELDAIANAFAVGCTGKEIAKATGLSEATICRRKKLLRIQGRV